MPYRQADIGLRTVHASGRGRVRATGHCAQGEGSGMEIEKEQVGDVQVVTAHGRLDGIYGTAFAKEVGDLITGTGPKVLIDFSDIDFVSSAGLRAVLLLMKKAKASGGAFVLCGVNEQVREVLEISGFVDIFSIHPGRAEGIAALKG
jgi:anti-anti-sigma factor